MLIPRDYQSAAVDSLFKFFEEHQDPSENPVVAMPTGTGKAYVIALFLQRAFSMYANQRVLVATHVKELVEQNHQEFLDLWPTAPAGIYSAGLGQKDLYSKITFCGIASIVKIAEKFGKVDLLMIDECHLLSQDDESMYMKVIAILRLINPMLRVIGLTATPWRLGQGMITNDGIFTHICFNITDMMSFNWLIKEHYLIPLITKPTGTLLDVTGVHMMNGDYNKKELDLAVNKDEITWAAVQETMRYSHDRECWLVFASSLGHAEKIRQMLEYCGVSCRTVHSKMNKGERDTNIKEWKKGLYTAIINMGILTTGVNNPRIDMIVHLRPTSSTVLWVQMNGRGTRPWWMPGFNLTTLIGRRDSISASSKHNCLCLDFAGNIKRLGPINDPIIPRKRGEKTGEVPIKICEMCNTYNHLSAKYCGGVSKHDPAFNSVLAEGCGEEFVFKTKLLQKASSADIIKNDMPIVETIAVDYVTHDYHRKGTNPPCMRVTYYCGLSKYVEFQFFETPGFPQRKAQEFWKERSTGPFPLDTADALKMSGNLAAPTHIKVWINKPRPEVLCVSFTGGFESKIIGTEVPF